MRFATTILTSAALSSMTVVHASSLGLVGLSSFKPSFETDDNCNNLMQTLLDAKTACNVSDIGAMLTQAQSVCICDPASGISLDYIHIIGQCRDPTIADEYQKEFNYYN
ncbi:hypothetical protein HDU76_003856, partial [Blyttiomyces sp. JEL0837]